MATRKFVLNGTINEPEEQLSQSSDNFLTLKRSYKLSASRADGEEHTLELTDKDYVEFVFDDDTSWFGNADTIAELFPEIDVKKRSADQATLLPFTLATDAEHRSIKSVALKMFNIFGKGAIQKGVHELAEYLEKKLLDNQSGVYQVSANFSLVEYKPVKTSSPILLFLHGTGSSTKGSFGELNGTDLWGEMKKIYQDNILAFQHETLSKSPLQNVLELIQQLPDQATLHLISHSRGGLVGECLARFCFDDNGFHEAGLELLKREERTQDIDTIQQIKSVILKKGLRVEKFIRVACPARGTSILSKRLDFYFNVTMNLASFAAGSTLNPVVDAFKALVTAVLDGKNDVNILPGLEAMCPSSPFLKALNGPDTIDGQLLVISGNANYSLSLKALVVIVSKLVFQGENDFVVNTPSMYQGTRRSKPLQYFYDEGAEVNHFSYFKNAKTQTAILTALTSKDEKVSSFQEYLPAGSDEAQRGVFGLEGGAVFYDEVSGKKPIVVVLPGIMGSNLSKGGSGIWLNYLKVMTGGLKELEVNKAGIKAGSLIKTSYKKLCVELQEEYDVVTFPYDWRLPLSQSAKLLNDKIQVLMSYQQSVKIVAHSMGGLVVKEFILNYTATWEKLNGSRGFTLLLLGTPWMGSYRIPNVLAGRDSIIKQLDSIDFAHSKSELVQLFSKFPGLLNLLPTRKEDPDFSDMQEWKRLQEASKLNWTPPSKDILDEFGRFRKNAQELSDKIDYTNIRYIAGKDDMTQKGYKIVNGELQFEATARGDQSVTWDMGIPSKLKGSTSIYYSNVTHGALACEESLFPAIRQLLAKATTDLLTRVEPSASDSVASRSLAKAEAEDVFETDEVSSLHAILGIPKKKEATKLQAPALKISMSNGDLRFSAYPIIIGHFKGDGIVSAERVADTYLDNELTIRHRLGNYPGDIGTYQLAVKNKNDFKGAVIVGLGDVDQLTSASLTASVEAAVTQYMLEYCKQDEQAGKELNGISMLLIGTDYGGLSIESSIRSVLLGVQYANTKINALKIEKIRTIEHIEFIELFEDRALQAFYTFSRIINNTSDEIKAEFKGKGIKKLQGSRKRLMAENKSDWWQRFTVSTDQDPQNPDINQLTFLATTTAAREEKQVLQSNTKLIEKMLEDISTNEKWSKEVAKTIFELLVPNEFKKNIKRKTDILWVLDTYSASFPWELLQADVENTKPLCVSAGMIRQLATSSYKITPSVNNKNVLVIGDPLTQGFCNQLQGAEKEAKEITTLFKGFDYDVESLIKQNSGDIVTSLFKQEYKMVHISGHGNFEAGHPERSGMIIGNNIFLTPREFNQLPYTPELVFVNCCFLGKIDAEQENLFQGRYQFAANIGTQLIQNGVKAVIAAGWTVDDAAAVEFAKVFYDCMFDGMEFGRAVLTARKTIYEKYPYTNTWGAFQCYGDPFYKLKMITKRLPKPKVYTISQEADQDIDNFLSKVQIAYMDMAVLREELDQINEAVEEYGVVTPEIREKIALAYVELNNYPKAIQLFKKVLESEKASYTVSSIEKYNNVLAKQLVSDYLGQEKKKSRGKTSKASQVDYVKEIDGIIGSLIKLLEMAETSERLSLIGSAYKRKVILCTTEKQKIDALIEAASYYHRAKQRNQSDAGYALINWIEIELFLNMIQKRKWGSKVAEDGEAYKLPTKAAVIADLKRSSDETLQKIQSQSHDYWDLVSFANTALCLWLLNDAPQGDELEHVFEAYRSTWNYSGSQNKKMSELEHFTLLIEFSQLAKQADMVKAITHLKEDLEKIVG